MSTLEIIEECLDQIHRTRQSSLAARTRKFNLRQERRKQKLQNAAQSPHRTSSSRFALDDDDQNEVEGDNFEYGEDILDMVNEETIKPKVSPNKSKVASNAQQPLFQGKAFTSVTETKKDENASKIYEDFKNDLFKWYIFVFKIFTNIIDSSFHLLIVFCFYS